MRMGCLEPDPVSLWWTATFAVSVVGRAESVAALRGTTHWEDGNKQNGAERDWARNDRLQIREAAVVEAIGFSRYQTAPFQGAAREVIAFQDPRELGIGDTLCEAVGQHAVE
jgi:hypothetical protein